MASLEKLTEKQIIQRVLGGEKALYEIIVMRFNSALYKVGRSYNFNNEDTEDIRQETFVDAYKNLIQFEGRSAFKTWIIRIMMNNCYRKKQTLGFKNEITQDVDDNSTPMFTNPSNDAGKIMQNRELGHIIENILGKIPFDYRMVFSLREINGLNVSETANLLNISENNVKVRLNRSKILLRREIEKTYSATELFEFNLIYCDAIVNDVVKKINGL